MNFVNTSDNFNVPPFPPAVSKGAHIVSAGAPGISLSIERPNNLTSAWGASPWLKTPLQSDNGATLDRALEWTNSDTIFFASDTDGSGLDWLPARSPHLSASQSLSLRASTLDPAAVRGLKTQIDALLGDDEELQQEGIRPSMPSFHALLIFLGANRPSVHPNLALTADGLFTASWSPRRGAKLSITYAGLDAAEWFGIDLETGDPPLRGRFGPSEPHNVPRPFSSWMGS